MALRIVSPLFDKLPEVLVYYILEFDPSRRLDKLSAQLTLYMPYFFRSRGLHFTTTHMGGGDKMRTAIFSKQSCGFELLAAADCDQCSKVKSSKAILTYVKSGSVMQNLYCLYCDECNNL